MKLVCGVWAVPIDTCLYWFLLETITVTPLAFLFLPPGYLPPPIRPSQLAQRLLQQQKYERLADDVGEVQEIEMEVEEQEEQPAAEKAQERQSVRGRRILLRNLTLHVLVMSCITLALYQYEIQEDNAPPTRSLAPPTQPPVAPSSGPVQIRKDYNPKVGGVPSSQAVPSGQFLISPITGEKIPAEKLQEHMRYGQLALFIPSHVTPSHITPLHLPPTLPHMCLSRLPCRVVGPSLD